MPRAWTVLWLVVAALSPASAAGECRMLQAVLSPTSGILPQDPVLFVFVPTWARFPSVHVTVQGRNGPLDHQMKRLSQVPAFDSYQLAVRAAPGEEVRVTVG